MKYILNIFKSKFFFDAGVYGLGSIINSAIPFLIMPILTRNLTPVDYGIVSMFNVLLSFTLPFIGVSTNSAIARHYYSQEYINLKVYLTNCFLILIISTVVVFLIFIFLSYPISRLSDFPKEWLWVVVLSSFCSYIITVVLTIWQMQSKSVPYILFQAFNALVSTSLSLLLVLNFGMKWEGRIIGQFISYCIFAALGIFLLFKKGWFNLKFNKDYIYDALNYGWPLIPHTIGAIIMTMSDRIFITNMVGLGEAGLYSVGYALGSIIGLIENSFNIAFVPWLFKKLKDNDDKFKIRIVKFTYLYFAFIITLAIIFTFMIHYLFHFFIGEQFNGAKKYIFLIALSFAFSGMYKMVVNYIFYVGKTKILAWLTFSSAMLNLVLNYFFINLFGAVGAAMATLFVNVLFFILTWILSNRIYKMPWILKSK